MIGPDDPNANSGAGGQGAGSSSSSGNSSSIGSSIEFVERMGRDEEEQQDPVDNNQPLVGNDDNGNSGIIRNSSLSNHDAGSSTYGSSTNGTSTPSLLLANEKCKYCWQ